MFVFVCLLICLFICLLACLSICLSYVLVDEFVCLFVCPSSVFIRLFMCVLAETSISCSIAADASETKKHSACAAYFPSKTRSVPFETQLSEPGKETL